MRVAILKINVSFKSFTFENTQQLYSKSVETYEDKLYSQLN